jgi:hypothetical protein
MEVALRQVTQAEYARIHKAVSNEALIPEIRKWTKFE